MADLEALESRLGYRFLDPGLLHLALTHPSVAHEAEESHRPHNQRLEFLGDAVLGMALTAELYARFPELGEGALTQARAQLVNRKSLAEQARRLGVGEALILSHGEEASGGRLRASILGDSFEALVGAIFLDGGFGAARSFLLNCFQEFFGDLSDVPSLDNPKGELQERVQARSLLAPEYQLLGHRGPDHDRVFECAVSHEGVELGRGVGKSKKAAESDAAAAALRRLRAGTKPEEPAGRVTEAPDPSGPPTGTVLP